jgi:hypothetical protein
MSDEPAPTSDSRSCSGSAAQLMARKTSRRRSPRNADFSALCAEIGSLLRRGEASSRDRFLPRSLFGKDLLDVSGPPNPLARSL